MAGRARWVHPRRMFSDFAKEFEVLFITRCDFRRIDICRDDNKQIQASNCIKWTKMIEQKRCVIVYLTDVHRPIFPIAIYIGHLIKEKGDYDTRLQRFNESFKRKMRPWYGT
jgi:hypothetical protein